MNKWRLLLVAFLAVALYRSVMFVDETEIVIVTQFGRPVEGHRLTDLGLASEFPWVRAEFQNTAQCEAGLHFKLPYQSAIRIDRRLQIYDPRPSEFLAAEKKNIDLDVFVCWRVAQPLLFLETVSDFAGAEARMHDIIWSELAATVGSSPLEALVSTDPALHRFDELVDGVAEVCIRRALSSYGIQIVDVRLKRISLPGQVRESVFERMRTERKRIAVGYRAEGDREARKIRAAADKDRTITLAEAYRAAEKIRGDAEAQATRIYAEAHQQDPAFYELLRTLEAYKIFLDDQTTILLSADSELLKYLTSGSMLNDTQKPSENE